MLWETLDLSLWDSVKTIDVLDYWHGCMWLITCDMWVKSTYMQHWGMSSDDTGINYTL